MHYSIRTRKCPETGKFVEGKTSLMEYEYILCVRTEQKQEKLFRMNLKNRRIKQPICNTE